MTSRTLWSDHYPTCAYCGWSPSVPSDTMYPYGVDGQLCESCHDNYLLRGWPAGLCVLRHIASAHPGDWDVWHLLDRIALCGPCSAMANGAADRIRAKLRSYGLADERGVTVRGLAALQSIEARTWDRKPPVPVQADTGAPRSVPVDSGRFRPN